ncbi:histidine kinase [Spirosoma sp. SC4-14]|uniref:sensor histidine kinase n=1 Tax=Spirosoma sp. SC4-14 TaxID=3128900 RepID=UPI0030D08905
MDRYHLKIGFYLTLALAVLASLPRVIRLGNSDLDAFLEAVVYTFVFELCSWLLHQYFLNNHWLSPFFRPRWTIGIVSVGITVFVYLSIEQLSNALFRYSIIWDSVAPIRRYIWLIMRGTLLSSFLFFVAYYLQQNEESQVAKLENERLKQENLKATLDVLKQQISPHFLFNSLNTLKSMSHEEPVRAFTIQLANVYRYLLSYTNTDVISVKDELAFAESYLSIQKARFGDGLRCHIKIAATLYDQHILPFVLQLLIENAIKHNTATLARPLIINIVNDGNVIVITNNRQPKHLAEPSPGLGLKNIQLRYDMIAHQKIDIIANESTWTVKVPLLNP